MTNVRIKTDYKCTVCPKTWTRTADLDVATDAVCPRCAEGAKVVKTVVVGPKEPPPSEQLSLL